MFDQTSYTFKTGEENPLSKIKYSDSAKAEAAIKKPQSEMGIDILFLHRIRKQTLMEQVCADIFIIMDRMRKTLGNVKLTKCQAVDATSSYYTVADGIPVAVQGTKRGYKYKNGWTGSYEKQTCTINGVVRCSRRMENG